MKSIKSYSRKLVSRFNSNSQKIATKVKAIAKSIKLQYCKIKQFVISKIKNLTLKKIAKWFTIDFLKELLFDYIKMAGKWLWDLLSENPFDF